MLISVSKTYLQIAKRSLPNFDENSVVSFLIQILRHLNAISTLSYTSNVLPVNFSVETIPANRKMQSFKFRRKLCYFVPDSDTTEFKRSFHSILHAECSACRFQCRNNPCKSQNAVYQISTKTLFFRSRLKYYGTQTLSPLHSTRRMQCMSISVSKQYLQIAKRSLSNFYEISVISFRIEILRRSYAPSTLLYTPNVAHVDFSVERIPANHKTQSFKLLRNLCHFRSVMRYYGVHTLFPLYSTRLTCCI
jgi:hypothetical protein